jgi:hypothetical protein
MMLPDAPLARFAVVQVPSDVSVAVCAVLSLFVQVTTSPTLAVIVAGLKAKFAMVAVTVPVSVDGAQASVAAPLSEAAGDSLGGASLAGLAGASLAGAGLVAVPPEQAETVRNRAAPTARDRVRDMWVSSWFRVRGSSLGSAREYAKIGLVVS